MNWLGMMLVFIGVVYLIYSILRRDRVGYYNRRYEITSEKLKEFLKLQLKISVLNSIYCILFGIIIIVCNLNNLLIFVGLIGFHFINFLLARQSKKKGYIV